jgi:hypothetical protein
MVLETVGLLRWQIFYGNETEMVELSWICSTHENYNKFGDISLLETGRDKLT